MQRGCRVQVPPPLFSANVTCAAGGPTRPLGAEKPENKFPIWMENATKHCEYRASGSSLRTRTSQTARRGGAINKLRGAWRRVACGEGQKKKAEPGSRGTGTLGSFGTLAKGGSERWRRRIEAGLGCGDVRGRRSFRAIFGGPGWLSFFSLVFACGHGCRGLGIAWGSQALGDASWRQMGSLGCAMSPLPLDLAKLVSPLRLVPAELRCEGTMVSHSRKAIGNSRTGRICDGRRGSLLVCEFVI